MTSSIVLCTSSHAVDLADGRVFGPGEVINGVDVSIEHNNHLIEQGHMIVLEKMPVVLPDRNTSPSPPPTPLFSTPSEPIGSKS